MQEAIEVLSSDDSDSDPEGEVKLTSTPNVITVSCCVNVIDVSTQTVQTVKPVKPVTCRRDEVLQKLEEVLDGLNDIQDELLTQSCDLLNVRNRCLSIEKQIDHTAHVHVSCVTVHHVHIIMYNLLLSAPTSNDTQQMTPTRHSPHLSRTHSSKILRSILIV